MAGVDFEKIDALNKAAYDAKLTKVEQELEQEQRQKKTDINNTVVSDERLSGMNFSMQADKSGISGAASTGTGHNPMQDFLPLMN